MDALRLMAALEDEFAITIDESRVDPSRFERLETIIGLSRSLTQDQWDCPKHDERVITELGRDTDPTE
jgi:hypothetical protein